MFRNFWHTHAFINMKKTGIHLQNLTFMHTSTFRMKSTESFIHEAPDYPEKKYIYGSA